MTGERAGAPLALHWAAFLCAGLGLGFVLAHGWRPPWSPLRVFGLLLAVSSWCLLALARVQLGAAFSARPRAEFLVTGGLYARLRNPIYLFSALLLAGCALYLGMPLLLLILVPLALLQTRRARRESELLRERFGAEYEAYRRQTWF